MFGENPEFLTQKIHSFSLYHLTTEVKKALSFGSDEYLSSRVQISNLQSINGK